MSKYLLAILLTVVTGTANAACKLNTIKGKFAASGPIESFAIVGDGDHSSQLFMVGRIIFDGAGKAILRNAVLTGAGVDSKATGNGSYSLGGTCVGVVTMNLTIDNTIKTKIKLNMIVSGTAANPQIAATYTDLTQVEDSGLLTMTRINL